MREKSFKISAQAKSVKKKILVVGAGPSGLIAIKSCKEEGLDVVCFEKTDTYGGSWNYRYDTIDGVGSIRKCTVSLYSKEMNAFSDFPPPEDVPNYPNHESMMDYIDSYAETNDVLKHVHLEHEILRIQPARDFNNTGRWIATIKSIHESKPYVRDEIFDGVISCAGNKGYPHLPSFPGQEKFKGTMLHSKYLRNVSEFDNKNVLIIGFGNSAVEAAVEISSQAKQVYLSVRSGGWLVPRVGRNGLPSDIQFFRRNVHFAQKLRYKRFCKHIEEKICRMFDHDVYKIRPKHCILAKHPIVNDDFPDKVLTGRILVKGNVHRFAEDGVVFEDEDFETKIDAVILATGYEKKIPFLQEDLYKTASMYKYLFPIQIQHPTLALIGLVRPMGPHLPVWESQCRLVTRVLSGAVKLPSPDCMELEMRMTQQRLSERFVDSSNSFQLVDYIEYMDELAMAGGFKPNISSLLSKDPTLCVACTLGPCLPYHYRLIGPHAWSGARQTILDYEKRVIFPLSISRFPKISSLKECSAGGWISASILSLAVCAVINSSFFI